MPLKRKTRASNNTSINTNSNVSSSGTNAAVNEDKGKRQKEKPYYSWW